MIKKLFEHPFRFRFEGRVLDNKRIVVDKLDIGIVWLLIFVLVIIF